MRGKEERSCLAWTALGCFLPITASSEDTISSVTEQKYMYLHNPSNIYTTTEKNPSFYKINSRCPTKESKAVNTCRRKDLNTKVTNCDLIVSYWITWVWHPQCGWWGGLDTASGTPRSPIHCFQPPCRLGESDDGCPSRCTWPAYKHQ